MLWLLSLFACTQTVDKPLLPSEDTAALPSEDTGGTTVTDTQILPTGDTGGTTTSTTTTPPSVQPPLGLSSGGAGGADYPGGVSADVNGVAVELIVPSGAASRAGVSMLMVYSGTEGSVGMLYNMLGLGPYFLPDSIIVILDGRYRSAEEGALVLDGLRASYDVDNDATWLLTESAGTQEGMRLGFDLRQPYFAAVWTNDVIASDAPTQSASQLGFAPWGNAAPGGDYTDAQSVVNSMSAAGYRLPADAPYSGSGAGTHGSTDQFIAAVDFFRGKSR